MKPIVAIDEARDLLGDDAISLSDEEVLSVINTLDLLSKDALEQAKITVKIKKDAKSLAELIYDIYKDKRKMK